MTRPLLAILSLLSLCCAMTLAAFWMRSYYVPDTFTRTTLSDLPDGSLRRRNTRLSFSGGECGIWIHDADFTPAYLQRVPRPKPEPLQWRDDYYYALSGAGENFFRARPPNWQFLGIACLTTPGGSAGIRGIQPPATVVFTITVLKIPLWIPLLLTFIPPFGWLLHRFLRRPPKGLCPNCNYDLRATPYQCPECGHVPQSVTERCPVE